MESAADVLTNPALLAQALHNAPPDWTKKNVRTKVISGEPAAPSMVGACSW